jgi:hypothetical protein
MTLKQLIRYTNADALEATWVNEKDEVVKCQAYSHHPDQMAMLRTDLGTDLPNYEELINEVASTYVSPPPPTDEEHNESIYFQIDQLERQYLMPRITREAAILQLETWALSQDYLLDQFRLANKGYRGLKELDETIQELRGQLR